MEGPKKAEEDIPPDPAQGRGQRDMVGEEGHAEPGGPKRHDRFRIKALQEGRVPAPGQAGQAPSGLGDRGRDDGLEPAVAGGGHGRLEEPERGLAVGRVGAAAGPVRGGRSRDLMEEDPLAARAPFPPDLEVPRERQGAGFLGEQAAVPEENVLGFRNRPPAGQGLEDDLGPDPAGIAGGQPDPGHGHFFFFGSSPAGSGVSPTL